MDALSGRASPPPILVLEVLSREYGWTPSEIRAQRQEDINAYLAILKARRDLSDKLNVEPERA